MAESPETIDITIEERRQSRVSDIQMNVEALMARDTDLIDLEPIMGYSSVNSIPPTDLLLEQKRPAAYRSNVEWNAYAERTGGFPEVRYLTFTDSFRISLNPRSMVQFIIWSDDYDESAQLLRSFSGPYDDLAQLIQSFILTSSNQVLGLDIALNEGDYMEYDATSRTWTVVASGETVVANSDVNFTKSGINVASISAAYYIPSQEQVETEGQLDDPLTPDIDEYVAPSSSTPYSDRIAKIKRELRFRNRGGRKMIGGILLLGIGIGLLYFFTKSRIVRSAKDVILESAQEVVVDG
jgi:hypothetical protein